MQRLTELYTAKINAKYIESLGGFEIGKEHYIFIVLLHTSFLISLLSESFYRDPPHFWYLPFMLFVLLQIFRIWTILSLGKFWNTRIYILPYSKPVKKGPYKYIRHPNYLVVMLEMLIIPFIFGAYITLLVFPLINFWLLNKRIHVEEKAMNDHTAYQLEMENKPRFIPRLKKY